MVVNDFEILLIDVAVYLYHVLKLVLDVPIRQLKNNKYNIIQPPVIIIRVFFHNTNDLHTSFIFTQNLFGFYIQIGPVFFNKNPLCVLGMFIIGYLFFWKKYQKLARRILAFYMSFNETGLGGNL